MQTLNIDIETYSDIDLMKTGVGKYADSPFFEILLFGYKFNNETTHVVDLAQGEQIPQRVIEALQDSNVLKTAYNAVFEITCIQKYLKIDLDLDQWQCTMVQGAMNGYPMGLDNIAKVLRLNVQKDAKGKNLIKYFTKPCNPTKANEGRTRNLPIHDIEKWREFKSYCKTDVEVEYGIKSYLDKLDNLNYIKLFGAEWDLWRVDTQIAMDGVRVDTDFIRNVINIGITDKDQTTKKLKKLTGLSNPNSIQQLKAWIEDELGYEINGLAKDDIKELVKSTDNKRVLQALKLKQELAKTSTKKYDAMKNSVCRDKTVKGLLQFYGANRTGRWAGRNVQIQNLPQNHLEHIDEVREDFKYLDYDGVKMIYDPFSIQNTLSQLVRTAFVPSDGCRFIVSDFSAIEARVIAYLAGEQWRLDVFQTHGKIYEASASQMFNVPIEEIGKGSELRQKGKIAELALGYGGGVGALTSMGALNMGLQEEELQPLVKAWRGSNPNITRFWKDCEKAAIIAVKERRTTTFPNGIMFKMLKNRLTIKLPSGRCLFYIEPKIELNRFGNEGLTYMGMNQTTKKWERTDTFGGKIVENIVQAFARDCLAESIMLLHSLDYKIRFHVHDEVVLDVPIGESSAKEVAELMSLPIEWAKGLPLNADAYECDFYMKD